MKTIKVLSTLFALMLLPFAANATPQLQLDCDPCTYDPVTEDNVADTPVFAVAAIVTPGNNTNGSNIDVDTDTFWMSIALAGLTDEFGDEDAANAIFNSLMISLDGGTNWVSLASVGATVQFGTPPSIDDTNPELGPHGYFESWYIEINLNALFGGGPDTWTQCTEYNVENEGWVESNAEGDSWCGVVMFDRGGMQGELHFDLYATDAGGQFKKAAPFSHDVTSVPEPGTLSLLGLGLLALGLGRRRREIA